ncbi:ligand-binding sensor domain-containing protein [Mucilaginibacter sp.]|uniref:ligand-binding sensor domain-containing protein n=1 Tax=Mucilaginibacter sp. TaxID=1882438 RepID=UPI003D125598
MKIHTQIYTLFLVFAFYTSCKGPSQTKGPYIWSETTDSINFNKTFRNIKQDRSGNILIAYNKGVVKYDGKSFTNLTSRVGSPMFWDVLQDRKGNFWLATRDSGVYYYNEKSLPVGQSGIPAKRADFKHFTTREGLANNRVTAIYEDKAGNIWFGTEGGVSRYDGQSFQNFTTKEGLSNNSITIITEDKTGKLWFGSPGELCFYDGKTFTIFKNKAGKTFTGVRSIMEDRKGNIWFDAFLLADKKRISPGGVILYGEQGLWRYNGSTVTKASKRRVITMIEDKKGNIWTISVTDPNKGGWALSRYDANSLYDKNPAVTEIMEGAAINITSFIRGILEAKDGSIWFGGVTGGLYRYDGKTIMVF